MGLACTLHYGTRCSIGFSGQRDRNDYDSKVSDHKLASQIPGRPHNHGSAFNPQLLGSYPVTVCLVCLGFFSPTFDAKWINIYLFPDILVDQLHVMQVQKACRPTLRKKCTFPRHWSITDGTFYGILFTCKVGKPYENIFRFCFL